MTSQSLTRAVEDFNKQLVLFRNVPLSDSDALRDALRVVQALCSKPNLARIYAAIHS